MNGTYNEVAPMNIGGTKAKQASSAQNAQNGTSGNKKSGKGKSKKAKAESAKKAEITTNNQPIQSNNNIQAEWPPALHKFVVTCFTRSNQRLTEDQKPTFNRQLQMLLERAVNTGYLFENNWDVQKLPILDGTRELVLECEQRKALEAAAGIISSSTFGGPVINSNPSVIPVSIPVVAQARAQRSVTPEASVLDYNALKRKNDYDSASRKKHRSERFESSPSFSSPAPYDSELVNTSTFVGTCQDLEKNYLRLTSAPIPALVRPQNVLEKSVKFVLDKFDQSKSYPYVINQLKSIRQDLTVQHIKNDFTVYVYETNAKLSLENGDLGEFNQCQSQLKNLYYLRRKGDPQLEHKFFRSELEFLVYRMIYMIITENHSEIYRIKLSIEQTYKFFERTKKEETWYDFLDDLFHLNQDLVLGDYRHFFELVKKCGDLPALGLGYQMIVKSIVSKTRMKAFAVISRGYGEISIAVLLKTLDLKNEIELDELLEKHKLAQFKNVAKEVFDCRSARPVLGSILNSVSFKKVDIKGQI